MGCGNVSAQYLPNGPRLDALRFVACADLDPAAADRVAREHGLEACTPEDLTARANVDVVLCLTPPDSHADVALQAIAAGKHVYTEKPLATSLEQARRVLEAAAAAGVLVGCAPDTFLGAGIQTLKAAIDAGAPRDAGVNGAPTGVARTGREIHSSPERPAKDRKLRTTTYRRGDRRTRRFPGISPPFAASAARLKIVVSRFESGSRHCENPDGIGVCWFSGCAQRAGLWVLDRVPVPDVLRVRDRHASVHQRLRAG
jgi:GFO/IDH/MocA oxidoreductase family protein